MFSFFRRKKPQPAAEEQQTTETAVEPVATAPETPPSPTPEAALGEESFDVNPNDGLPAESPAPDTDDTAAVETAPAESDEAENEEVAADVPTADDEADDNTAEASSGSPETAPPASTGATEPPENEETAAVAGIISIDSEADSVAETDNRVDEFEIDTELLGDAPADDKNIKAAVQAMQTASGSELFDFDVEQAPEPPAAPENETVSEATLEFPESLISFYDDGDGSIPEPLVLRDDDETVDAQTIEAEMLAMAEAAGAPPSFADLPAAGEEFAVPLAEGETEAVSVNLEAEPMPESEPAVAGQEHLGWAARLKHGLTKSRNHMAKSLAGVFGGGKIDEDLYEELETVLLTSDMGIEATERLMDEVRHRVSLRGLKDGAELRQTLKDAVYDLLKPLEQPLVLPESGGEPFVIMMAGINGAGKTTSIGKLAKYFQAQGKSVVLAAGDTFRAAAREQLQEWGKRNGVMVISQASGDSAAVCFDAVEAAKARKIDIVLADTAGRLPTQLHLMEEIKKVKRVLQKAIPDAPHEIMLVLDANIGQNALNQVKAFNDALEVSGLIVTKLDGTAKGGVLAALACNHDIPVRYIGVGEKIDDLRPFDTRAFVEALFGDEA